MQRGAFIPCLSVCLKHPKLLEWRMRPPVTTFLFPERVLQEQPYLRAAVRGTSLPGAHPVISG